MYLARVIKKLAASAASFYYKIDFENYATVMLLSR